ncbi:tRNA threonylcarbamoyladenosine dehydratase [Solemya elarraichensis gill symbiont]|uniref:tRNA cyclic N6-threonylcarbamoyladenosine(37) synthase TcdA n=1 Tax=Solemya elarraichensis gill symbiont TaxID=1918949 RepID=A0A1T2L5G2_9GAMM|nr:tRNA threonylcarbamoyladenosine dehydratase [Solemya elarraichensis gill symbiont]OOZ40304.1 tRNA cyclic N6-threonylcarbamoyladenosine(37) synthase TcdA [Solemya elarraichensis gill symbiont]
MTEEADNSRRFGGIVRLYGETAYRRFLSAHVCVIGVGGVGSWVVESLARSAIGRLTLIDMDHVSESNINRQLPALTSTLGAAKVQVLKQRVDEINPHCQVDTVEEFVTVANPGELIPVDADVVVDCIDSFRDKAALIAWCRRNKQLVITVGGAGGKSDASLLRIADLSRTEKDALLSRVRKQLRQDYNFPRNPKRRFSVPAIYSTEESRIADIEATSCSPQQPVCLPSARC